MSVRVRFAPSPSGYLHVGGARTALFNWLFARHHHSADGGAKFILRVEDTDAARSSLESVQAIITSMKWLGLDWDEGPDVGGPHAPYFQSERKEIYQAAAQKLVNEGKAYPCFCKPEDLDRVREQQEKAGDPVRYNGKCAKLSVAEAAEMERDWLEPSIRFRVPAQQLVIPDLVKGPVEFDTGLIGDLVIMRSNGQAMYNFACVVDDAAMGITHVIRGDEHLVNAPRQTVMYHALGYTPPLFAHLPLILGKDRKKLSKRDAAVAVGDYEASGHLPEGLVNYLGLLGWSPGSNEEIFTRAELTARFGLDGISSNPAIFDTAKLAWMNQQHVKKMPVDELARRAESFLVKAFGRARPEGVDEARFLEMLKLVSDALVLLQDVSREMKVFFDAKAEPNDETLDFVRTVPGANAALVKLRATLAALPEWTQDGIKGAINALGKETGLKGKNLFHPVRAGFTGYTQGADLVTTARLLGRERVLANLDVVTQLSS